MTKNINKNWLTLIEVLISTLISAFILAIIFKFLFVIYDEIDNNINNIKYLNTTYVIKNEIEKYSLLYTTGSILIDNDWADVFLFKNEENTKWVLLSIVDRDTKKISTNTWIYENKTLWFRMISGNEIIDIQNDINVIYDFEFMNDMLISDLYIWYLDIKKYNTNIYNIEFQITNKLYKLYIWKQISELPWKIYKKFNINF